MIRVEYLFANYDRNFDYGFNGAGWYFWDETEAYCYGPYESAEIAEQ